MLSYEWGFSTACYFLLLTATITAAHAFISGCTFIGVWCRFDVDTIQSTLVLFIMVATTAYTALDTGIWSMTHAFHLLIRRNILPYTVVKYTNKKSELSFDSPLFFVTINLIRSCTVQRYAVAPSSRRQKYGTTLNQRAAYLLMFVLL